MSRGLFFLGACLLSYTTWTIATPASGGFEVVVGLPVRNVSDMDQLFWRVADPGDELYLRHRAEHIQFAILREQRCRLPPQLP